MDSAKPDDLSFQAGIISRMMHLYGCAGDAGLAERLGVQKGAVSNYRNGRRKIPITLLYKVA
ncbi:MAG: helix-turn-helix domain-containing protein, partial [Thermodesulfobacteriota bacterium]